MNGWTPVYDLPAAGFDHGSHMQFLVVPTVFLVVGLVLRFSPRARARVRSGIPISWIPWIGAGALAIMGAGYAFSYGTWLDLGERLAERRVEVAVGPLDRVVVRQDGERIDGELAVRATDGVREYHFPANRNFLGFDGRNAGLTPGTCTRITSVRDIVSADRDASGRLFTRGRRRAMMRMHAVRRFPVVCLALVLGAAACERAPAPPSEEAGTQASGSGPSAGQAAPPSSEPASAAPDSGTDAPLQPGQPLALSTGDTVIWIGAGPAEVPGEPTGLFLRYQVSFPFADTLHVERVALAVWREHVRPRLGTEPPFVALSAARPDPGGGAGNVRSYGIVLARTPDGRYAVRKTGRIVD